MTAAVVVALAAAATAAAAPPKAGLFVAGVSLGGLRLGMTPQQVRAAWGPTYGRCRACRLTTWYFNYAPFAPQGAGVEFRRGRVDAVFTLWSPPGWHTSRGLRIGDDEARVTDLHGGLERGECSSYVVLVQRHGRAASVIYVVNGRVWGFALLRAPSRPCR